MIREMKITLVICILCCIVNITYAQLKVGFYSSSCPRAEAIVRGVVQRRFARDRSITAALLRMYFHDCFVSGCDASILIDSKSSSSEKFSGPNETVRGFELIDEVKKALEANCPSSVSCADIIALATRDSVALAGGPNYRIPTGRRDGIRSNIDDVNLPGSTSSISESFQFFKAKGLTLNDMVVLLGAHTVGVAHCSFFQDRLSPRDPTMDPKLAIALSRTCGVSTRDPTVFLDQGTSFTVDNQFYNQTLFKRGIMQIDQELALNKITGPMVRQLASNNIAFKQTFGNALIKLGNVQVLVGKAGQIRKSCRMFNPPIKSA